MATEYLTVKQAAQELGVSRSTVWRWIDQGRLGAFRMGGRTIRLRRDDVEALPQEVRRQPATRGEASRRDDVDQKIWSNYDPERAREALRRGFGILKGLDVKQFKKDMREARDQDTKGRPAWWRT